RGQRATPMIVQELHRIQERCGYLPADELRALSQRTNVPLHRLHEVASFFPHYRLQPPPALEVKVCRSMTCHLHGARRPRQGLAALAHEIDPGIGVDGVSCLGQCDSAPYVVSVNDRIYWGFSGSAIRARLQAAAAKEPLPHQHADRSPLGWKIDPY